MIRLFTMFLVYFNAQLAKLVIYFCFNALLATPLIYFISQPYKPRSALRLIHTHIQTLSTHAHDHAIIHTPHPRPRHNFRQTGRDMV